MTIPAEKDPTTASKPIFSAITTNEETINSDRHTGNWLLDRIPRASKRRIAGVFNLTAISAQATASAVNPSRTVSCNHASNLRVRSKEVARMGPNSPIEPAASTWVPKRVFRLPESCRLGMIVPRAVVERVSATIIGAWTMPSTQRIVPSNSPSPSDRSHPPRASSIGRPRTRPKSMSMPAMNKSAASPAGANQPHNSPCGMLARPRTAGPTVMPRRISHTASGIRTPILISESSDETTAIDKTMIAG
jgi:hypothetical protein